MRASIRVAATCLLGLASASAWATESDISAAESFLPAFKAGDAAAVTACYAPDAVLWVPNAPMATGHEQIRAMLTGYFAAYTIKDMTITPLGSRVVGDEATAWGTFRLVSVAKDTGVEIVETGRFVDVSRRIDGRWVYIVDHASNDPPPPAAK